MRVGDALAILPELAPGSVDFIATDPPYNIQLPITMAGGALAETHANRRTDYAMVTDDPADLANSPNYEVYLDRMEFAFGAMARALRPGRYAAIIVRDAYQAGRYLFTGSDLAARASHAGLTPKGDLIWVSGRHTTPAVRIPEGLRAQHRPPTHPGAARRVGASRSRGR